MITAIHLVKICHLTQSRFSFSLKTFKTFSLSNFQAYNTVWITVGQPLLNEQMSEYFLMKNSNIFGLLMTPSQEKVGGPPRGLFVPVSPIAAPLTGVSACRERNAMWPRRTAGPPGR